MFLLNWTFFFPYWQKEEVQPTETEKVEVRSLGKGDKLKREEKGKIIADLKDRFSNAKAVLLTDYKGLTVAEMSELRRHLKDNKLEYRVVKNTLAKFASEDTPVSVANDLFKGPLGVAISYDDPIIVTKKVLEFSKKNEKLKISGGIVEGKLCSLEEIKAIANLPNREVLLSMLAGLIKSPLSKMAGALAATVRSLSYALEALKRQKESAV